MCKIKYSEQKNSIDLKFQIEKSRRLLFKAECDNCDNMYVFFCINRKFKQMGTRTKKWHYRVLNQNFKMSVIYYKKNIKKLEVSRSKKNYTEFDKGIHQNK